MVFRFDWKGIRKAAALRMVLTGGFSGPRPPRSWLRPLSPNPAFPSGGGGLYPKAFQFAHEGRPAVRRVGAPAAADGR